MKWNKIIDVVVGKKKKKRKKLASSMKCFLEISIPKVSTTKYHSKSSDDGLNQVSNVGPSINPKVMGKRKQLVGQIQKSVRWCTKSNRGQDATSHASCFGWSVSFAFMLLDILQSRVVQPLTTCSGGRLKPLNCYVLKKNLCPPLSHFL